MLFLILFSISQSIRALETNTPATDTIPISVSIDQMDSNHDQCDSKECSVDKPIPDCGNRCLGTNKDHYFQYTFFGEQFQVYGSTGQNYGEIKIYLDGNLVETVNTAGGDNPRTLLYTSEVLTYGSHTIKVDNGNTNNQYGIYKFAYWPSIKSKRINFTDDELGGNGNWQKLPDGTGSVVGWTNNQDSTAQSTITCSRIWVYGVQDPGNGKVTVSLYRNGNLLKSINFDQGSTKKVDGVLIFDSDILSFAPYLVKITNPNRIANSDQMYISLAYIYYEYDPPTQSPAPDPTQPPEPITQEAFINKEYHNYIPCGFPSFPLGGTSVVKEIRGCKFYDIVSAGNFLGAPFGQEIGFSDNLFEYSDGVVNPTITYFNLNTKFTIERCTFTNYKYVKQSGQGLIFSFNQGIKITFDSCRFNNIGQSDEHIMFKLNGHTSTLLMRNCTFYNDELNDGSKISSPITEDITFEKCTFIRPARDMIRFTVHPESKGTFKFIDNVVEKGKKQFIMASKLWNPPVIQNNVFQDFNIASGYLITFSDLYNTALRIELYNNTHQRFTTHTESSYGGGASYWFQSIYKNQLHITYRECKFYDITNNNERSPYNQGGAIQYGYTTSISDVDFTLRKCIFRGNSCPNGNGGAVAFSINHDLTIVDCTFENNNANSKGGAIYFWSKIQKPSDNPDAPVFNGPIKIAAITITNCQFKGNSAYNGHSIYIDEYYSLENTKLSVSGCTITDNGNGEFQFYAPIGNIDFSDNTIQFNDKQKSSAIFYVSSDKFITIKLTNSNFINCYYDQLGIIEVSAKQSALTVTNCHFTNCECSGYDINYVGNKLEVDSCSFSFDDSNFACAAITFYGNDFKLQNTNFKKTKASGAVKVNQLYQDETVNHPVLIQNCIFDQCVGTNLRCFDITVNTNDFVFKDIVFQNHQEFLKFNELPEQKNQGYFLGINCNHRIETLVIDNITFLNNRCNSDYGGGSGIWITDVNTIKFINCKFHSNTALQSPIPRDKVPGEGTEVNYFAGDGGAVQFGFSNTIYKSNLIFDHCEFIGNKAVRHGGALALQTVGEVTITGCTFNNNEANYKDEKSASLLEYKNYFSKKTNGRGGAIYINPCFNHGDMPEEEKSLHMISVKIEESTFEENTAFDGYIMYIQGEDPGTTFDIKSNTFKNNYNKDEVKIQDKSSILTELPNVEIPESNTFIFTNEVDKRPVEIEVGNPEDTEDDGPDYFEVENVTSHGRHDYVVDDNSKLIVSVILSYFHDIKSDKDGGALYIKNAGLACTDITFYNCSSENKKGGAIYLYNKYLDTNYANIIRCNISGCSAKVGGGLFIYSDNKGYSVIVRYCTFAGNKVDAKATENIYGGSAAFIAAKKGRVKQNTFIENEGEGNMLRLTNDFNNVEQYLSHQNNDKLIVSKNKFVILNSENGAVFYSRGKGGNSIELSNCIFEGKLKEGRKFIEGESTSKSGAPKLVVKNCKFDGDSSNAMELNSDFLDADLNQQVFNSNNNNNNNNNNNKIDNKSARNYQKKSALSIVVVAAIVSVAAIIGFVLFFVKKSKKDDLNGNEMSLDANDI